MHAPRNTTIRTAMGLAVLSVLVHTAHASRHDRRVGQLPMDERHSMQAMVAMSAPSLDAIATSTSPERLEGLTRDVLAVDSLSIAARAVDADGRAAIHRLLLDRIQRLSGAGLELLGTLKGAVAVPVATDRLTVEPADPEPPSVRHGDRAWRVHPVWPNGAMPSLCPREGLAGPLVFVGDATWESIETLDLKNAIALMNFAGGRNWERLLALGAQAVIVRADAHVNRANAVSLFCNTPIPFPRFYVDRATGAELAGLTTGAAAPTVTLSGGSLFENRPIESIFAYLPPTAPRTYAVTEADLLDRIARDHGTSAAELMRENALASPALTPGRRLDIPGRVDAYVVTPNDLLARLSVEYGIAPAVLLHASGLTPAHPPETPLASLPELRPGQTLTIPNVDESLVILCRIDSVSAVPDAPHGAAVAANLAATLAAMEQLADAEHTVRRKGVVFAFLDGDNHGGRASRALAETVLLDSGELKSAISDVTDAGSGMYRFLAILCALGLTLTVGFLTRQSLLHRPDATPRLRLAGNLIPVAAVAIGIAVAALIPLPGGGTAETRNRFAESTEAARLADYQTVLDWTNARNDAPMPESTARWFVEEWLATRFENARIALAEERIAAIQEQLAAHDDASRAQWDARLAELDAEIAAVVKARDTTFGDAQKSLESRVETFRTAARGPASAAAMAPHGLDLASLRRRMQAEYDEDRQAQAQAANNVALVHRLARMLHPDPDNRQNLSGRPVLGFQFDLSDGSRTLTTAFNRDGRGEAIPGTGFAGSHEERYYNLAAYASVRAGWSEEWPYFGGSSHPDFNSFQPAETVCAYSEFLQAAQIDALWLRTQNDTRPLLDTPGDTIDGTDFRNLAAVARMALVFVKAAVENHADSAIAAHAKPNQYGRLVGKTVQFNIRSGIDAQDPVARALVYVPDLPRLTAPGIYARNSAASLGGRPGDMLITRLNGAYAALPESISHHRKNATPHVFAYRLDRNRAIFTMTTDQASIGTQRQSPIYSLVSERDAEKKLVLTAAYPLVVPIGVDPMDYVAIPSAKGTAIQLFDAVLGGPPRHFAVEAPAIHYRETDLDSTIVYGQAGRNIRLVVGDIGAVKAFLISDFSDADDMRGVGYPVGPTAEGRNIALRLTPLHIAEDLQRVADKRRRQYRDFGIRDQAIDKAVTRSAEKLADAQALAAAGRWQSAIGAARESWGILIKNYPTIMKLGRESVFSVVFLMALLIPASAFIERLVIGAKGVMAKLAGAGVIFSICTVFLKFFHPAFEIAISPFIIVIAFIMILMSSFVLGLCYQRFEVLVRRARIAGGEVESEEISFASSLATAFALGVSNLKKRPTRTALTTFTVSVLTFSIITFVSVKGQDTLSERQLRLETEIEDRAVDPLPPRYNGVLFRGFNWAALGDGFVSALRTEYGRRYPVVSRAYYIQREGGNNADREGVNQIELRHANRAAIINGIMCYEPAERELSGLDTAVSHKTWFDDGEVETNRFQIILPDATADAMGIAPAMLVDAGGRRLPLDALPAIRMLNHTWHVIGILDTAHADRIRDIDGKSLAMVDYLRSGVTPNATGNLENESETHHVSWRRLGIVPMAARTDVAARWRSVAIRFPADAPVDEFRSDIALRMQNAMFSHNNGKLSLLSTKKQRSVGGLAKVVVPIILCILIVANTMLGTIDERRGEVEMLGAVGLSPRQISFLLLSEATVFSVLGIVFGVSVGLAFSRIMLGYPDRFGGLSFNFTSLASTWLAMSTGLIVLLATLIPARRAAAMAAPSGMEKWVLPEPRDDGSIDFNLPFTLTRGNAVGMVAFFRRFLLNHTESTSLGFNCRDIGVRMHRDPDKLSLTAHMWLAPYDLDVAQHMELTVQPTENEGVFRAGIFLHRSSGTEEAWVRTNYTFMDLVRLQFLLWRNLRSTMRQTYIQQGALLLTGAADADAANAAADTDTKTDT